MNIIKFLAVNWDSVLLVIAFIVGVIYLYKNGYVKILQTILFSLVTKAERDHGGGTGELKKAIVLDWVYEKIPTILQFFISKKELEQLVESVLAYAKAKWAANPRLLK